MAKRTILAGVADQTIDVFIADSSSSTGAGLSGLAYNTSGLKCYYRKNATGSATALTLATQTVGGAHSDGGFVEIDATNMKGVYRLDLSDTIVATGPYVVLYLYGATNMAPTVVELELVAYNPFDGVRLGITALPNAAAEASGGLYTRGTGAGQIKQDANGRIDVNVRALLDTGWLTPGTAGTPDVNVKLWNGLTTVALPLVPTIAGRTLDVSVGGEAGVDWANIGGKTTTNDLTNTKILGLDGTIDNFDDFVNGSGQIAALANGTITAAVIADSAIDNATFAADVGSTAIATNVIGIAAKKGVVDAINVDTYAEPAQGAPAATNTLVAKIGYLFKNWRNKKTQTSTTWSLLNDDATTVDHKATVADDGTTASKGEVASGP